MDSVIFLGRSLMQKSRLKPASVEQYKVKAVLPLAQMDKTTDAVRRFSFYLIHTCRIQRSLLY
jgi:hypothetical protein